MTTTITEARRPGAGALGTALGTALDLAGMERIKLLGNRSFWWCGGLALVLCLATAAAMASDPELEGPVTGTEFAFGGSLLVIVMAACAVTGEFRHGTMRVTFLAAPYRAAALGAKTAVMAAAAGALGLLVGLGGHLTVTVLRPEHHLVPGSVGQWRAVAGVAVVYALVAVVAVAVGMLVRHTAGAVAGLLSWVLLGEGLLGVLPRVGETLTLWLPFRNAALFLDPAESDPGRSLFAARMPFGPWGSLAWFTLVAAAMLAAALVVANRRDA